MVDLPPESTRGDDRSVVLLILSFATFTLTLLCIHFWADARDLSRRCSLIPDNMLEVVPNE